MSLTHSLINVVKAATVQEQLLAYAVIQRSAKLQIVIPSPIFYLEIPGLTVPQLLD